jgi:hypothetical protein
MRPTIQSSFVAALTLCAALAHAQLTPGGVIGGQPIRIEKDSAASRVVGTVYEGRFSYVRIETREPGAATNQHPFAIAPAALRAVLEQVQLAGPKPERLLTVKELDEIVEPLSAALARATAEQDVSIAVSDQFGFLGPLASRAVTTARVFRRDGQLQFIAGLVRRDFESQFRGSGMLIPFEPGQRAKPVERSAKLGVTGGNGSTVRDDWVALSTNVAAAAPAPAAVPVTSTTPAATAVAPAATAAAPAVIPAPAARDADTIYRTTSERLRALEKLFKDGLISEAEYQEKRRQILRDL